MASQTRANGNRKRNLIQALVVLLVLAVAVFVTLQQTLPPAALPASTAATEFSADRAVQHVMAIAQQPRLVGFPGFAAAQNYVTGKLRELGLTPEIQKTVVTMPQDLLVHLGWDIPATEDVENIVARIEGSGSNDAILLVSHLDSIGGTGASDDANGVAVLLETARALRAGPPPKNTVMLLFTAPEETGLHGSAAFILQHPWAKDAKLVINFDAGGLQGPSELTNMSEGSGWLVRNLARADPYAVAVSDHGIGDSDFNTFKYYGYSGYAFDYARDRRKHSLFDNVANLNPPSIQDQGYHALNLARYYGNLDSLADPKEPDPVYFNILRLGLVHYPSILGIVATVACILIFAGVLAVGFRRRFLTLAGIGLGALVFIVSVIMAPLVVRLLWAVLSRTVPAFGVRYYGHAVNEPLLLAIFACVAVAVTSAWYALLLKIREVGLADLAMGAMIPILLYTLTSIASPESSFRLTWTLMLTLLALGFWFLVAGPDREVFSAAQVVAVLVAAIVAVVLLVPSVYMGFTGSDTDDLLMPMAGLVMLLGLLAGPLYILTRPQRWWLSIAAGLGAIVLLGLAI